MGLAVWVVFLGVVSIGWGSWTGCDSGFKERCTIFCPCRGGLSCHGDFYCYHYPRQWGEPCITSDCAPGLFCWEFSGTCRSNWEPFVRSPGTIGTTRKGFKMAVMSDIQLYYGECQGSSTECIYNQGSTTNKKTLNLEAAKAMAKYGEELMTNDAKYVGTIMNGDWTHLATEDEKSAYDSVFGTTLGGKPVYYGMGNHELQYASSVLGVSRNRVAAQFDFLIETVKQKTNLWSFDGSDSLLGNQVRGSLGYSYEIEGYYFIMLHYAYKDEDTADNRYVEKHRSSFIYEYDITSVEEWFYGQLEAANRDHKPIVLVAHSARGLAYRAKHNVEFRRQLAGSNILGVFSGHLHPYYGSRGGASDIDVGTGNKIPVYYSGAATYNKFLTVEFMENQAGMKVYVQDVKRKTVCASTTPGCGAHSSAMVPPRKPGKELRVVGPSRRYFVVCDVVAYDTKGKRMTLFDPRQSSVFEGFYHAGYAIDDKGAGSCAHTYSDAEPWWAVTIPEAVVAKAVITLGSDFAGSKVYYDGWEMATLSSGKVHEVYLLPHTLEIVGRSGVPLTLCEVQMWATGKGQVSLHNAQQSSTGWSGAASRAIDGSVSGQWSHGSCTHTNADRSPYWRAQYNEAGPIWRVSIFNRQDCCGDRLGGARVVMNGVQIATVPTNVGHFWSVDHFVNPRVLEIIGKSGVALTLCEVQMWATGTGQVSLHNAQQSSTAGGYTAYRAVDGSHGSGQLSSGRCSQTLPDTAPRWKAYFASAATIWRVSIFNRQDCCGDRLGGARVLMNGVQIATVPTNVGHFWSIDHFQNP